MWSISYVDFANSYILIQLVMWSIWICSILQFVIYQLEYRVDCETSLCVLIIYIYFQLQVAEEYRLVPDTLYLTVNYIDRYLSGNPMNRQQLQLLGVASMMIAS